MDHRIVIDTDGLVGLLRDEPGWVDRIAQVEEKARLFTTDLNAFELHLGAQLSEKREANAASVKGLLNTLTVLSTSEDAMEVAGRVGAELRSQGRPIDVKDLLIASVALVNGCGVLTGNVNHFDRVEGLDVLAKGPREDGS